LSNIPDDINGANNQMAHVFAVDDQEDFIPLREQFETVDLAATNWITINEDNSIGWEITTAPSTSDNNTAAFMNFYDYGDRQRVDWLISPSLDFSEAVEASITFRTSYAKNLNFNDQLRVLLSMDCGNNFDNVLEIYNSSDLSIQSSDGYWKPANQNDWKEYAIDLDAYAGEKNIRLAFLAVNDYGNNLYLDDIEFYTTSVDKIVSTAKNSYTLFPNPTENGFFKLAFNTSERQEITVFIYDQMGRVISIDEYKNTLNQTYYYDLTGFRSGVYFITAKGKDFVRSKKLVISR